MRESAKNRLPKLVISKFESAALDWFRFWDQHETDVDKIIIKVGFLIDILKIKKFMLDGYARAKSILLG